MSHKVHMVSIRGYGGFTCLMFREGEVFNIPADPEETLEAMEEFMTALYATVMRSSWEDQLWLPGLQPPALTKINKPSAATMSRTKSKTIHNNLSLEDIGL